MVRFACPRCKKVYQAEDDAAGKKAKCSQCGVIIVIPNSAGRPTAGPADLSAVANPVVPEVDADIYNFVDEPAVRQSDTGSTLPVSSRMSPINIQPHHRSHASKRNGPSMALMTISGFVLVGVAIVATLWIAGQLSTATMPASMDSTGFSEAACKHLTSEIEKWMTGGDAADGIAGDVVPIEFLGSAPPIAYEIKSVLPTKPSTFQCFRVRSSQNKPKEPIESLIKAPCFLINVTCDFKSQAGTLLKQAVRYTLLWEGDEGKWYIFNE